MKNKLTKIIFPLLSLSFLLPYPALAIWWEAGNPRAFSGESIVSFAENLEPGGRGRACYVTDALNQPDCVYSQSTSVAPTAVPDNEHLYKRRALAKLQSFKAGNITSSSEGILIAVLDTGIDQTHKDLLDRIAGNMNFSDSPTPSDLQGHGTHIAGIIVSTADNDVDIVHVAPDLRLLNVKVTGDSGMVCPATIARGIVWAADNGAKVINMSFTISSPSKVVGDAVNYAWSKGAVTVSATNNSLDDEPVYPAYYDHSIAVTVTDAHEVSGTSYGNWIDVSAPGINVYSTLPDNKYGTKSGTSMAAAYVSGIAGLLFSVADDVNGDGMVNDDVRYMIENNCDDLGIIGINKRSITSQGGLCQGLAGLCRTE